MDRAIKIFWEATQAAAMEVAERDDKPSFLESTLEAAIVDHLPGRPTTAQGRRRFRLPGFEPPPFGVDIDWSHDGVRVGVEVKVWDVLHSLFDVVKLETAIANTDFGLGFCAVAAMDSHWAAGSPFTDMTDATDGRWHQHDVEELLTSPKARDAVLVKTGPRPWKVPGILETLAFAPIEMPKAPGHSLRLLAIRPTAGAPTVTLPG